MMNSPSSPAVSDSNDAGRQSGVVGVSGVAGHQSGVVGVSEVGDFQSGVVGVSEVGDSRPGVVRLLVAYDGTEFRGFAESAGVRTVLGELRGAIERIVGAPIEPVGAGRTDAGVHGWGQVVSFTVPERADGRDHVDLGRLQHSVNRMLGPEISIRDATWASPDFNARFAATARAYRYDVWNDPVSHPLRARTAWHVPWELDIDTMSEAAAVLVGEHDFSSFCRRPKVDGPPLSLVRRVLHAGWVRPEPGEPVVRFEVTATAFCQQMVRSFVGTLVEVGLGKRSVASVRDALTADDRAAAGKVAPPHGLVLWHVDYSGTRWDARAVGSNPDVEPSR